MLQGGVLGPALYPFYSYDSDLLVTKVIDFSNKITPILEIYKN